MNWDTERDLARRRIAHLAEYDDFLCRLLQHSVQHAVAQPDGSFPCPVFPVLMLHVGLGKSDEHQTGVHQVTGEKRQSEIQLFLKPFHSQVQKVHSPNL